MGKSQIRHLTSNISGMLNNYDNKKLGELFNFDGAEVRAELERQKAKGYRLIPSDSCKHFCVTDGCKCRYWQDKNILKVVVKKECFNLIKDGFKKKEYREIKAFWIKRLINWMSVPNWGMNDFIREFEYHGNELGFLEKHGKGFDAIEIKNGYQTNAPVLLFEIKNLTIEKPNKNWVCGLFNDDMMFAVEFGNEIARLNCL